MTPIYAFVIALFATNALAESPCSAGNFRGRGFEINNFRPVSVLHDNQRLATLYRSALNSDEFSLVDYRDGIFYSVRADGSCVYFSHDKLANLLVGVATADVQSSLEIDGYRDVPVYGFVYDVPDSTISFRGLQLTDKAGTCHQIFVGVTIDGIARATFFHQNTEPVSADEEDALGEVAAALKQMEGATCEERVF